MRATSNGKQELPPPLLYRNRSFCDLPAQSRTIGEFQHIEFSVELRVLVMQQLSANLADI
jgi:ornithine cyclodeaminase